MEFDIRKARVQLSRLIERTESGEEITITREGMPVARIVPVESLRKQAQGMDAGKVWIADDFDAPDPEIEALFYGEPVQKPRRMRK